MTTTLTVNGTPYTQSGRKLASLLVDAWGWDADGDYWCEFHEYAAGPQPQFTGPVSVSLALTASPFTQYFTGQIVTVQPAWIDLGRTWGYRALGLKYLANWLPVTANDGSGYIRFNVNPTNQGYYVATMAGQSVGQILSYCLTLHATALTAIGVTTDSTTASSLAALTLVPSDEVDVTGEHLWAAVESVLAKWQRNIRLLILPSGLVRVVDVTAGAAHTLTLGSDPVVPPLFSRNWTTSATRFTVRGRALIEPGYVQTLPVGGIQTLTPAWTTLEQNAWTYADWTDPTGHQDNGTVTTVNSATQVTVQSANALEHWVTNYWNGIQAWIYLFNSTGLGVTYSESRQITACSSMTAGGTATITMAYALANSASGAYNSYKIIATNVPLSLGGLMDVWRLYDITDPGGLIANHLVPNFPVQVPFVSFNGQSATLTNSPEVQIVTPTGAGSGQFSVLPETGQVIFIRPVVEASNSLSVLQAGGSGVVAPTNIYMLLPYSRGALSTTYPSSGYQGTAYTKAGLQRTAYADVYSWGYQGNVSVLNDLAQMLCQSIDNTLVEGTVHYYGWYTTTEDPTGGHLLNFAGVDYTTGDEALDIPVRSYTIRYMNEGMEGLNYTTEMRCSTRQDPRTGEGQYTHLSALGSKLQLRPFEQGVEFVGGGPGYGLVAYTGYQQTTFDAAGAAGMAAAARATRRARRCRPRARCSSPSKRTGRASGRRTGSNGPRTSPAAGRRSRPPRSRAPRPSWSVDASRTRAGPTRRRTPAGAMAATRTARRRASTSPRWTGCGRAGTPTRPSTSRARAAAANSGTRAPRWEGAAADDRLGCTDPQPRARPGRPDAGLRRPGRARRRAGAREMGRDEQRLRRRRRRGGLCVRAGREPRRGIGQPADGRPDLRHRAGHLPARRRRLDVGHQLRHGLEWRPGHHHRGLPLLASPGRQRRLCRVHAIL